MITSPTDASLAAAPFRQIVPLPRSPSITSVSYTHLDVYKRQVQKFVLPGVEYPGAEYIGSPV